MAPPWPVETGKILYKIDFLGEKCTSETDNMQYHPSSELAFPLWDSTLRQKELPTVLFGKPCRIVFSCDDGLDHVAARNAKHVGSHLAELKRYEGYTIHIF
jgi:hypothetical protein